MCLEKCLIPKHNFYSVFVCLSRSVREGTHVIVHLHVKEDWQITVFDCNSEIQKNAVFFLFLIFQVYYDQI